MNSKSKKVFVIVILLMIILGIIFFLNSNKKSIENNKERVSKAKKSNWYVPEGSASEIDVYENVLDNYPVFIKEDDDSSYIDDSYEAKNTYNCNLKTCKTYGYNKDKSEVVIKDDGYIIYNYEKEFLLSVLILLGIP